MSDHASHPHFARVSHLFPMTWSFSVAALADMEGHLAALKR
jgi:hypothetical protein